MRSVVCMVIATILWGVWPIFLKLASKDTSPVAVQCAIAGMYACALPILYFLLPKSSPIISPTHIAWAVAGGLAGLGATLAYAYAVKDSQVSSVLGFTAINPLIAFFIAFLCLGEKISFGKWLGIVLMISGSFLLSRC